MVGFPEVCVLPAGDCSRIADGQRASFDLLTSAAGAVVGELTALASVRDLSLVEPDIEDVVARLYRS
ncbi:hypothetical protein [Actinoplanes sp. NPDC051859]|uniref:hypothetical protein n=1 Tax=Actinoplanes sp. NPDC051859 TaxID=3363909 RepID=UPI00378A36CF